MYRIGYPLMFGLGWIYIGYVTALGLNQIYKTLCRDITYTYTMVFILIKLSCMYCTLRGESKPVSRQIVSPPKLCPPILQQCYARAILHPLLVGTVLLHHSLGL